MISLPLARAGAPLNVLCLGAHSDDIEIGAGATLLGWIASGAQVSVHWAVLSAVGPRETEARASAQAFLAGAVCSSVDTAAFRDGHFPYEGREIKAWMEALKARIAPPDVILTHWNLDAHQDHRMVAELTTNTFRDHLALAYEIPKWDGDMGRPVAYIPATAAHMRRKIELLGAHFATQRGKDWFDGDTFLGLARLRGMECRAPERYAEAFHVRKLMLG